MAELQQTIGELQKALQATRQAREEDQHAQQQEVEERDRLIQSFSSENQRLHRVLQVRLLVLSLFLVSVECLQTCGPPGAGGGAGGVQEEDGGASEGEGGGG